MSYKMLEHLDNKFGKHVFHIVKGATGEQISSAGRKFACVSPMVGNRSTLRVYLEALTILMLRRRRTFLPEQKFEICTPPSSLRCNIGASSVGRES
jgi:hypothetical protein